MDIKRTLAVSIAVQSLGTIATFLTVALVAALDGPAAQGVYAQTRAWVDLMIAFGAFGFPSAIIYALNRLGFSVHRLTGAANKYGVALLVPLGIATVLAVSAGVLGGVDSKVLVVACLAPAGAAGVVHMLWRSMYLTFDDGTKFALFTIIPNLALLVAVVTTVLLGHGRFEIAFLVAYLLAIVVAYIFLQPVLASAQRTVDDRRLPIGLLATYGLHQMLQSLLATGQLVGLYWLILWAGGDDADIGLMNMAVQAFFGVTIPVSMIVPILLNRWTRIEDEGLFQAAKRVTRLGVPVALGAAPILALLAYYAVPGIFGEGFRRAALPAAMLALAVVPGFAVRIASAAFQAAGRPEIMTWLSLLRVAFGAGFFVLLANQGMDLILAAALAWGVAETLCAIAAHQSQHRILASP